MVVKLRRKGKPLSEGEVRQLEERLGHRLPSEYRGFLREHDGGVPESNTFAIPGADNSTGVIEYLSAAMIVESLGRLGDRLAQGLLPIAHCECGDLVCVDLSNGRAEYWDHELEDSDPIQLLAESFDHFLEMLEPFDQKSVVLKPGQVESAWVDPDFLKQFE